MAIDLPESDDERVVACAIEMATALRITVDEARHAIVTLLNAFNEPSDLELP